MTNLSCISRRLTLIAILAWPITALAQKWTPEQMEVWQTIENCWAAEEEAELKACFHDDYSFWWAGDVMPFGKNAIDIYWNHLRETNKAFAYNLRPVEIIVHGDVALVQQGNRGWVRGTDGSIDEFVERISMTLVRENGRWQYLGGGGSPFIK